MNTDHKTETSSLLFGRDQAPARHPPARSTMIQRPSRGTGSTLQPPSDTSSQNFSRSRSQKQQQQLSRNISRTKDAKGQRWHSQRIRGLLSRPRRWKRKIVLVIFSLAIIAMLIQQFSAHHDRQYKMRLRHKPHDWSWWQHQHQQPSNNANATKPWIIFYNIYIPEGVEGQAHARSILKQQIDQVKESYAATGPSQHNSPSISPAPVHLFYNTIGAEGALPFEWMQEQGSPTIRMHFGKHYPHANEDATLQDIYDFCQVHSHAQVIYLHSKGTFHYPKANETFSQKKFATQDRWRQIMTQAATHEFCLDEQQHARGRGHQSCDTCSLVMQPLPGIHYPGNMWTAKCRYIRKLKPALGFEYDMNQVVGLLARAETQGSLGVFFYPQMPHLMGRHRYAFEHWLGSHPQLLNPCHITTSPNMSAWLYENLPMGPAQKAPSFAFNEAWDFHHYHQTVATLQNETQRKCDYFLLAGQILRWIKLYKELPPSDSWVWTWFPDGLYFQSFVEQFDSAYWASLDDAGILNFLSKMAQHAGATDGGGNLRSARNEAYLTK